VARATRRAGGFTLVEVLVALAIFALIGLLSAQILTRIVDARARTEARGDRLLAVQRAVLRLERDLLQAVDRPVRDRFGDAEPALRAELPGVLTFTRDGWRNPLELPRSDLQRVQWRLGEEGTLERAFWTVLDRAEDSDPLVQSVLEGVDAFAVTVIDAEGAEWEVWPPTDPSVGYVPLPGEDPESAPPAVALRVAFEAAPWGRVERLLPLPERLEFESDGDAGAGDGAPPPDGDPTDGAPPDEPPEPATDAP
jgi:general secretion pathway protein J